MDHPEGQKMTFSISFSNKDAGKANTIVIGIMKDNKLSDAAKDIDKKMKGLITATLKNQKSFEGKSGQTLVIPTGKDDTQNIILAGLGDKKKLDPITCETIGGKIFAALKTSDSSKAVIHLKGIEDIKDLSTAEIAARISMGLTLASYRFDKYKSKNNTKTNLKSVSIITDAHTASAKLFKTYEAVAQGVFLARDLVNEPPNTLYPENYVKRIKEEFKPLDVEIEVLNENKMKKMGFGALLAVGQGSEKESQVVIMKWNGGKKTKNAKTPIAFVGKGVTFDTGGISIKPSADMDLMKMDMGGSAAVVGAIKALALRKAKVNAVGIIGLVENMPSDRAYRPGDIIKSHAGKTIEVLNTDAEGRLVLADLLTYIQKTHKPEVIIDLATLTGAIMVGLGFEYCGAFANDNDLWSGLDEASKHAGEKFWRMPLDEAYRKEMESDVADLKNLGSLGRYGGACSAAGFLEHFIEEGTTWAHIDIAGTAWWKSSKPTTPKGGTGFGVRTLNDFVANKFEK